MINMRTKGLSASQISDCTIVSICQVYQIHGGHEASGRIILLALRKMQQKMMKIGMPTRESTNRCQQPVQTKGCIYPEKTHKGSPLDVTSSNNIYPLISGPKSETNK